MLTDRTGLRLGVFEILGLTGAGGMGEVWRALDTKLQREVAIRFGSLIRAIHAIRG